MSLTGRTRFRANWRGKLLLQVEVVDRGDGHGSDIRQYWRDAEVYDLGELQHLNYSRIDVYLPQVEDNHIPPPGVGNGTRKPN